MFVLPLYHHHLSTTGDWNCIFERSSERTGHWHGVYLFVRARAAIFLCIIHSLYPPKVISIGSFLLWWKILVYLLLPPRGEQGSSARCTENRTPQTR